MANEPVQILQGKANVVQVENTSYRWTEPNQERITLEFSQAYHINHKGEYGLQDCAYKVHEKTFVDLDCMKGKTLKTFDTKRSDQGFELRQFGDGKKFLYAWEDIPTFDSDDRVWDSFRSCSVFLDEEGINLIDCRRGYRIPRIEIYLGLRRAEKSFLRWLIYLGCRSSQFPEIF